MSNMKYTSFNSKPTYILIVFFFIFTYLPLSANKVLSLYKSSEGASADQHEAFWHLSVPFQQIKYQFTSHDIDHSLPGQDLLKDVNVIITWYRGPKMKAAALYCHWLKDQMLKGTKVMILGNFGAYQDLDSDTWVDHKTLNVAFNSLGYEYVGNWSNDPAKIQVSHLDSNYILNRKHDVFNKVNYYMQFKPISKDQLGLIVTNRKDLNDSKSVMLGITPNGCLANAPFLMYKDPQEKIYKFFFDKQLFIQKVLNFSSQKINYKNVIAFYKSIDGQTEEQNEIVWHLVALLKQHDFTLTLHDICKGLPNKEQSEKAGSYITWFRSSAMKNAKSYLNYMNSMLAKGKRVAILGSMGAHQERGQEAWFQAEELDKIYKHIGLSYLGNWTNQTKFIKLKSYQHNYFHKNHFEKLFSTIPNYLQLKTIGASTKVLLEVERTDIEDGLSTPVVLSPNGGFADSSYLFSPFQQGESKPFLKLETFILHCLLGDA